MGTHSIEFPAGTAVCAPGDHLLCRSGGEWKVYRVKDLVLLQRLVPALPDPSALFVEEQLLDSRAPAYADEVHLIVTELGPSFASEAGALRALRGGKLEERTRNLIRSATEFPSTTCRRVSAA